jgi:osmotically inducible lipoprotein OsmB
MSGEGEATDPRRKPPMTRRLAGLRIVGRFATVGWAHMTPPHQRALSGGAMGAAGGAAVGARAGGSPALGAFVGGAAGTAVGALWDEIHTALK